MSLAALYNVTPHPLHIYAEDGKTLICEIPSHGELRLESEAQAQFKPLVAPTGHLIPVHGGQKFKGIDQNGEGYGLWATHDAGGFIVSLPMAMYLAMRPDLCGNRRIYCPATNKPYDVRDASGKLIGCKEFESHY